MLLILLLYALLASTFTLGKAVLDYAQPVLVIAVRMLGASSLLLGYLLWSNKRALTVKREHLWLFAQIVLFHIYISFIFEFWALQYLTSAKTSIFYNLAPFITAIFAYYMFNNRLTRHQKIGLSIGFLGFLPVLMAQTPREDLAGTFLFISLPEIMIILSVVAASYGWIVMKRLMDYHYSPLAINGIGMLIGGLFALVTSFVTEGWPTFTWVSKGGLSQYIFEMFGATNAAIIMFGWYTLLLIIIANIIFYNLYGVLLKRYTATFLSFAGFLTPLFAALFGWVIRGEVITWEYFATVIFVVIGLYLFYKDELRLH